MSKAFIFDDALRARAERFRALDRRPVSPGATVEMVEHRMLFDREHSAMLREAFLDECERQFAASRRWMISGKASDVPTLFFGTTKHDEHGPLPPALVRLVAASIRTTTLRSGAGGHVPSGLIVHALLSLDAITAAAIALKTAGLTPERLPFSWVNPWAAQALLIIRPSTL